MIIAQTSLLNKIIILKSTSWAYNWHGPMSIPLSCSCHFYF